MSKFKEAGSQIEVVAPLLQVFDRVSNFVKSLTGTAALIDLGVNVGTGAINAITRSGARQSYQSFTKNFRVEPICLISADLSTYEELGEVANAASSLMQGYYLQAVTVATHNELGIPTSSVLDQLSPTRSIWSSTSTVFSVEAYNEVTYNTVPFYGFSLESIKHQLPIKPALSSKRLKNGTLSNVSRGESVPDGFSLAIESSYGDDDNPKVRSYDEEENLRLRNQELRSRMKAADIANDVAVKKSFLEDLANVRAEDAHQYDKKHKLTSNKIQAQKLQIDADKARSDSHRNASISDDTLKNVKEAANFCVGKLLKVPIITDKRSGATTEVPISFRLMSTFAPESSIVSFLTSTGNAYTLLERYHLWKIGALTLIGDMVLCRDIHRKQARAMIADKTGAIQEIVKRGNSSKFASMFSKKPSLATASSIYIISERCAKRIEFEIGGSLTSLKVREKIFNVGYGMLLVIVDRDTESVTIYTDGIAAPSRGSIRDLRLSNKSANGANVLDIMKAYQGGMPPSL